MKNQPRYTITLDDDPTVCKFIERATGINSLPFTTGGALLKRFESYDPVAVFIDIHLDIGDCGLDVIPKLRSVWTFTPIIVVTGSPEDSEVGNALAAGANDFVRKPLNASEVVARLHTRLNEMSARKGIELLVVGDLKFSLSKQSVEKNELIAYLPKLEAELLALLLQSREMVLSRDEVKRRLWGRLAISNNTLDKKISGVRSALADIGSNFRITTLYGKGIILSLQNETSLTA